MLVRYLMVKVVKSSVSVVIIGAEVTVDVTAAAPAALPLSFPFTSVRLASQVLKVSFKMFETFMHRPLLVYTMVVMADKD